jgi:hypothetical protein
MKSRDLALAVLLTSVCSACVNQGDRVFEREFSAVRRVIPEGSNEQCSPRPTSSSIGLNADCVVELSGSLQDTTKVIVDRVPATYRGLHRSESELSYVRDFGNDSYYLTFVFAPVSPARTRVQLELKSIAN